MTKIRISTNYGDLVVKLYDQTPFLDNQYTVFGELESGFDIVEKIQNVQTDEADRPLEDVKILSATII